MSRDRKIINLSRSAKKGLLEQFPKKYKKMLAEYKSQNFGVTKIDRKMSKKLDSERQMDREILLKKFNHGLKNCFQK
jgi:hypothetical protein